MVSGGALVQNPGPGYDERPRPTMTISIKLPEDAERGLAETAKRLNVRIEDLSAAVVLDLVALPGKDFEAAAQRVLKKNRDLYRRLA